MEQYLIKQEIYYLCEHRYKNLSIDCNNYLRSVIIIQNKIHEQIQDLKDRLDYQQQLDRLRDLQILPVQMDNRLLTLFIMDNFKCISNIHSFTSPLKRQVLCNFYKVNIFHAPSLKVYYLKDKEERENKENVITMPRESQESNSIMTQIVDYLKFSRNNTQISNEIIKQILIVCNGYYNDTNHFYRQLSINQILMDQKKVKPFVSYNNLIHDALGIQNNVKSLQLKLATKYTPQIQNIEQSYHQTIRKNKVLLNRKYCSPSDKSMILQQIELQQKIIVWRLLIIFHYILKSQFFTKVYQQKKNKPFQKQQYYKFLKEVHYTFSLKQIIPQEKKCISIQFQESNYSLKELTFKKLMKHFKVDENQDSLLEGLKLSKMGIYFNQRNHFFSIIKKMIKQTNKLQNESKCILIILLSSFAQVQFNEYMIKQFRSKNERHILKRHLNNQSKLINQQYQLFITNLHQHMTNKQNQQITFSKLFKSRKKYFDLSIQALYIKNQKRKVDNLQLIEQISKQLKKIAQYEALQIEEEQSYIFVKFKRVKQFIQALKQSMTSKLQFKQLYKLRMLIEVYFHLKKSNSLEFSRLQLLDQIEWEDYDPEVYNNKLQKIIEIFLRKRQSQ